MGRLIDACKEKASIKVWNAADIGVQTSEVGLEGSLTHVIKTFAPKFERQGEMLSGDAKDVANTLVAKLKESKLI
jgi:electron transfer flavoprotein beta subunit